MRTPIFVRVEQFDLKNVSDRIEAIRNDFDRYLNSYPARAARTKHSLMGPVGKVLQEAKTGKWDAESLTGYALNIHLSNPKTKGFINQEAREALKDGVSKLMTLLREVPATAHDKILDRIDYGLYFVRRAKGLEWLEDIRQEFVQFLRNRYRSAEELARAWGEKLENIGHDFERIPYPSRGLFGEAKDQKKRDIAEFAEIAELKGYNLIEEEEEL